MKISLRSLVVASLILTLSVGGSYASKVKTSAPGPANVVDVNGGELYLSMDTLFTSVLLSQGVVASFQRNVVGSSAHPRRKVRAAFACMAARWIRIAAKASSRPSATCSSTTERPSSCCGI